MSENHLESFKSMLDRAGYEYEVCEDTEEWYTTDGVPMKIEGATVVTVQGNAFYDELRAAFDEEVFLMTLSSHVAFCPQETKGIRLSKLPKSER